MSEEKKEVGKYRMVEILKSHGIEMQVDGCGCCGSPWVTFKYKGETLLDVYEGGFDTGEVTLNAEIGQSAGTKRNVMRNMDMEK